MKKLYILLVALFCLVGCSHKLDPELAANCVYVGEVEDLPKRIERAPSLPTWKLISLDVDSVKITFPEVPMKADMYTTWIVDKLHYDYRTGWTTNRETIHIIVDVDSIMPMKDHPDYIRWTAYWGDALKQVIIR